MNAYQAGIFFDNEENNINTVAQCGANITSILVPSSHDFGISIQSPSYQQYKNSLSGLAESTADVVENLILSQGQQIVNLDLISGINQEHINYLIQWVTWQKQQGNTRLVAIFDWDRTLSVIEGLWAFGTNGLDGMLEYLQDLYTQYPNNFIQTALQNFFFVTILGFVEFYCGGANRVAMLQQMFNFLYQENVHVIVLTNNPTCITNQPLFQQMMSVLTNNRPVWFLCSYAVGGNKKAALQHPNLAALFSNICPVGMGGKRNMKKARKSRKQRKGARRNTRSHR